MSYVGTFGRHNQAVIEGNPETQAGHDACLATPACSGDFYHHLALQEGYP